VPDDQRLEYREGKRWCETVLARSQGFPWVVLRPPAIFGADDPTRRIAAYLPRIEDGGPLLVPEESYGRQAGLAWVRDVGYACALASDLRRPLAGPFNVAFDGVSLEGLLQAMAGALGRSLTLVPVPFERLPEDASPYGPDPRRSAGYDLTRSRRELGFEPSALADALPETLQWYLATRPSHPGYAGRPAELELARRFRTARRLRFQAGACHLQGSPLYRDLLELAADDVAAAGAVWKVLEPHADDPGRQALARRLLAAVHRLRLSGRAPDAWERFLPTVAEHAAGIAGLLGRPCQTNEVGRCVPLLGGFLAVAAASRLPLRLLEIGASAGLLLRWDRYRYTAGGRAWGDPDSPLRLTDLFDAPPPFEPARVEVAERSGCDLHPLDPGSPEDERKLRSFLWPGLPERQARLAAALEVCRRVPATVERADAASWLDARLKTPVPGVATVVFHSITWQYLEAPARAGVEAALRAAGQRATAEATLAHLRLEPAEAAGPAARCELRPAAWPGGEQPPLAQAGPHGNRAVWLA